MKKVTTKQISEVYAKLADAKITKMEDADKFKVIKALKQLKSIATAYEDFKKDAGEKLKGEEHDKMIEKAQKWQNEGKDTTLTEEEKIAVNKYFSEYNDKISSCLKEEAAKENELTFEALTEEAFGRLMTSNDWTLSEITSIEEILV